VRRGRKAPDLDIKMAELPKEKPEAGSAFLFRKRSISWRGGKNKLFYQGILDKAGGHSVITGNTINGNDGVLVFDSSAPVNHVSHLLFTSVSRAINQSSLEKEVEIGH